jgi:tungstate transport system ATP-binding protein
MIGRLEALDIKKQFNSRFRLSCSLAIEKGPLYTIVGPNGSGKSTLLRMLALIEPPDSGKIIYYDDGTSLLNLNPCRSIEVRRKAVLVPTRAALFNESVFDNAAYGLRLRGFSRDAIRDPVMESLKEVRLAGRENSHAFELSSGEAQRLALARALAIDPEVLLLDEPTASLDVENTEIIKQDYRDGDTQPVSGKGSFRYGYIHV